MIHGLIKYFLILITCGLSLAPDCSDEKNKHDYKIEIEDHETEKKVFPDGEYYSYSFPETASFEFDVEGLLEILLQKNIKIYDAWYKNYNSSCSPPGSEVSMPAIVEPVLIIKIAEANSELKTFNFEKIIEPDLGWCAYRIKHYIFNSN
jgi:hypothetical protein